MTKPRDVLNQARDSDAYWFGRVKLHVATQLQDALKASGLNQNRYAEALGVKPPMVSRLINGQGNPTLETLVKAGRVLGYVPHVSFVPLVAPDQLGAEENELLTAFDRGALKSVATSAERETLQAAARATRLKGSPGNALTPKAIQAARAGKSRKVTLNEL